MDAKRLPGNDEGRPRGGWCPLAVCLLAAATLLAAAPLRAQLDARSETASTGAPQDGAAGYRSPLIGAVLQAMLPPLPLGYVYAGDISRGLVPTGIMVGGATLLVIESVELVDWTDDRGSETLLYVGLGALMAGYVYGVWDVVHLIGDRNARTAAGAVSIRLIPTSSDVALVAHLSVP